MIEKLRTSILRTTLPETSLTLNLGKMDHSCSMVPITLPGGAETSIFYTRKSLQLNLRRNSKLWNLIYTDLQATRVEATLAGQRTMNVNNLVTEIVKDVHFKRT